jgi:hypothetical protein
VARFREGQVWETKAHDAYEVRNVDEDREILELWRGKATGHARETLTNGAYPFENMHDWNLVRDVVTCPECGASEFPIPEGDFICVKCRETRPIEARLVADLNENATILSFSGAPRELNWETGGFRLVIRRDDLPTSVVTALKRFLGDAAA